MIRLTPAAASHILSILDNNKGICISVKPAGCSGFKYDITLVDNITYEMMFESHGVKIFLNRTDYLYLVDTVIDYVTNGLNSSLQFINSRQKCGCGESFI